VRVPSRTAPIARRVARGILLAAGVTGITGTFAQTRWIHSLTAPAEIEYDSNPNMSSAPSAGTTWLRVTPSFTTRYVLGADEFGLDAELTAAKSSNTEVAQDRLDPKLRAVWKHADALNTTEFAALLDRSALRDAGLTEQVPLGVDGSRTQYALSGKWTRDLDARSSLLTEVGQEWEKFSGTATPDFSRTSGAVRYTRALSERQSWYAALNGQAYRSESSGAVPANPAAGLRSTVVGALAGVKHEFSPSFQIDASAGPLHFLTPDSRTGWQGGLRAEYTAERGFGSIEVSRAPVVNATSGGLVVADQIQLRLRYDLGPLQRLELEAGHAREKASRNTGTLATVAWMRQWTQSWQAGVKASTQRQVGPAGTATSNRVGVVFVYTAPDL
jgi:hypothetical protein